MHKDSKVLIVGHGDIIENALFNHLVSADYKNVFSSSKIGLNTAIQPSVYDFFQRHRPEYIFLASVRSGGIEANQRHPADFLYQNLESQNNIFYAAWKFGIKKLLYFGATCVYPKNCLQPMKEEYLLTGELEKTSEPYSVAKIAGIKLCETYKKQYGLNAAAMIPATIYGPGSDTDAVSAHVMGALIGKFAQAVLDNRKEVTVWGTGKPRREFLFVDDFVEASLFLMDRCDGLEWVNAGGGYDISIKELANLVARASGFKGSIVFDTSKPDGTPQKLLDSRRMTGLGWKPKVKLEEGIQKTYQWYWNNMNTSTQVTSHRAQAEHK